MQELATFSKRVVLQSKFEIYARAARLTFFSMPRVAANGLLLIDKMPLWGETPLQAFSPKTCLQLKYGPEPYAAA
jgi:hypothetical protein